MIGKHNVTNDGAIFSFIHRPFILCILRSSGTHQRSILFPEGNKRYSFVSAGNKLAARFCLLILYSLAQGCRFLLEQPAGSFLSLFPRLQKLLEFQIFQTTFRGGAYSADRSTSTPKRHICYSNDRRLLQELSQAAGHLSRDDLQEFSGQATTKRRRKEDGSVSWTGNKEALTNTQWGT